MYFVLKSCVRLWNCTCMYVYVCVCVCLYIYSRSQCPRGLRRRSTAARLLDCGFESHRGMDVFLLWVLCGVRQRSLRRADHASRGVLLTVMRRCVWSRNLKNEETMARVGPQRHGGGGEYVYMCCWLLTTRRMSRLKITFPVSKHFCRSVPWSY